MLPDSGFLDHSGHHLIGWSMPICKGFDVYDDLFAHLDSPLKGGGPHVGQKNHVGQFTQAGVEVGAALVDVKARTGQLTCPQGSCQRIFVNDLPA